MFPNKAWWVLHVWLIYTMVVVQIICSTTVYTHHCNFELQSQVWCDFSNWSQTSGGTSAKNSFNNNNNNMKKNLEMFILSAKCQRVFGWGLYYNISDIPVKFYLDVDGHMYTHQITQHHLCYSSWYSRVFQDHIKPHIHDKNNTRYAVAAGHKYFSGTYLESWFTERPLCHTGILVYT